MNSYLFMECCGCGTTEVFLDINETKFTILHYSYWMGYEGPIWYQFEGLIDDSLSTEKTLCGYIHSAQFMIEPSDSCARIGAPYTVPPHAIKVVFTRLSEKKLTDNALMPDPMTIESHLGMGYINMGNGANYNTKYQLEMRFVTNSQSVVKFKPYKATIHEIETMIHPDEQFLEKIINMLKNIDCVQMGQFNGDIYEEKDDNGKTYMRVKRSDFMSKKTQMG